MTQPANDAGFISRVYTHSSRNQLELYKQESWLQGMSKYHLQILNPFVS